MQSIIAQWHAVQPSLPVSSAGIIERLTRLMIYVDESLETSFAEHDVTKATFDVLAALRRHGEPYKLTQSELLSELMRSSGTVSVRIDRLEQEGLVKRAPSHDDRRSVIVSLTPKGYELIDRLAPIYFASEALLIDSLSAIEQSQLAALMSKLLVSFEAAESNRSERRLGVFVYSRSETVRLRRAVGLPDRAGVLIRSVQRDTPAERAGLSRGDLIVAVGTTGVRSWSELRRAILTSKGPIKLSIVRGTHPRTVDLSLAAVESEPA